MCRSGQARKQKSSRQGLHAGNPRCEFLGQYEDTIGQGQRFGTNWCRRLPRSSRQEFMDDGWPVWALSRAAPCHREPFPRRIALDLYEGGFCERCRCPKKLNGTCFCHCLPLLNILKIMYMYICICIYVYIYIYIQPSLFGGGEVTRISGTSRG